MRHDHVPEKLEYSFRFRKTEEHFNELWAMKFSFREHVQDWFTAAEVHPRISEIWANACSELFGNCIKHTRSHTIATVKISLTDRSILVETINEAEQEERDTLRERLDTLHATPDPKHLVIDSLMHPVKGKRQAGLTKIAMDTKGTLELMEDEDREVVHVKLHMHNS
ncbi:MAG: hypothetical protein GY801_18160 [bacterium]|nr:hypothetical protein [bacterium]